MTPLLKVQDLHVHLLGRTGRVKAVNGVTFSIADGETLGLVGESGSGKSLTCLAILQLLPQSSHPRVTGQVRFQGEDLLAKTEREMQTIRGGSISMVLQDPMTSLNPVLSVGEQVAEPLRLHQGLRGREVWDKVVAALRMLRIPAPESRLHSFPHQLSGGMRQRVVGAAALSCQPRLLIADEPTTALDVTIQSQYLALLKQLQRDHRLAILLVTHDFSIVRRMCDRVAVMYGGRIVEQGPLARIIHEPRHPYTAALLRSVPRLDDDAQRLQSIVGQPPDPRDLPPGCHFEPRCPLKEERCRQYPPLAEVAPGHVASCWKV